MAVEFESIRSGLHKIVLDLIHHAPQGEAVVLAWPLICGARVSCKTRVLGCEGGVLRIEAPDRSWCTELEELASKYVGMLNSLLAEKIDRIEFSPAQRDATATRRARRAGAGGEGK